MSPGVQFPADAVLRHAAATGEASARMAQARSAVHEVTMDSEAYGQLCRFLPALLSPLLADAVEVMNGAVEALGETALKLRSTATALQAADTSGARRVDAAGTGIELPL
jgi:Excreted virulence factor EspC, type VII ESX diderm